MIELVSNTIRIGFHLILTPLLGNILPDAREIVFGFCGEDESMA